MSRGHSALAVALVMIALMLAGSERAAAQEHDEQPPDLNMLLNLDLFAAPADDAKGSSSAAGGDSMFEQIRTLNAMGYLDAGAARPAQSPAPSRDLPQAQPSPGFEVE